jgi:hypothetical protein
MNKDRIQINGEWYVKENTVEPLIDPKDVTYTIECVWEDTNWCFVASLYAKEDDFNDCYDDVFMKITDKRIKGRENWVEEDVDNPKWILGVLEGNLDSMEEANEMFDDEGLKYFKAFAIYLIDKGWLKK